MGNREIIELATTIMDNSSQAKFRTGERYRIVNSLKNLKDKDFMKLRSLVTDVTEPIHISMNAKQLNLMLMKKESDGDFDLVDDYRVQMNVVSILGNMMIIEKTY